MEKVQVSRSRFPDFPRGPDGKWLVGPNGKRFCRGCKTVEIPSNRSAWCSRECVKRFHPGHVKLAVYDRGGGKCVLCGSETWPFWKRWERRRPTANFDHIIPHSEGGGPFVLENVRLLCAPCHKKRTAEWRRERAKQKAA